MVGFDHSVENSGAYDLAIKGNQFPDWSEPGIVWVMQDENGDGEPTTLGANLREVFTRRKDMSGITL
ncbi:MAG: hypothetical protein ACLUOS_02440 [Odoribacter splanchnicus]